MLILTRRFGEKVYLCLPGTQEPFFEIYICSMDRNKVRIGFNQLNRDKSPMIPVFRSEVVDQAQQEKKDS